MSMDPESFDIEPLGRDHDRAAFCSGYEVLDRYLKSQAGQDARKNAAPAFVLVAPGTKAVKGYYTLSMTGVDGGLLPPETIQHLPKYPIIPAILLGRLAVDWSCRGRGIGRLLISDAMKRGLRSQIGWAVMVVDAIDEQARAFYEHYGFKRFPGQPMKLFMMKKAIEQSVM